MIQVLWERGFINTEQGAKQAYNSYSISGFKDQFGNRRLDTSLKELISCLRDFEEEETMLQSIARQLGVRVDRTPKCHCELAGEGIEYAWACAKNKYRSILLENKKGKENFITSVRLCTSTDVLTRERVKKFARRARRYIMGYHVLHQSSQQANPPTNGDHENSAIIPVKLEQMIKKIKTHRCALDFDYSFCKEVFNDDNVESA